MSDLTLIPETRPDLEHTTVNINDLPPASMLGPVEPTPELIESIRTWGLLQPLVLSDDGEGGYKVHGGRRRIKALVRLAEEYASRGGDFGVEGNPFLFAKAVIVEGTGEDANRALNIALNAVAKSNPAQELEDIEALIKRGADEKEIARATGLKVGTIRSRLRLSSLTPGMRKALREGRLPQSAANVAARLGKDAQNEVLGETKSKKKITKSDVEKKRRVAVEEAHTELGEMIGDLPGLPEEMPEVDNRGEGVQRIHSAVRVALKMGGLEPGAKVKEEKGKLFLVADGRRYRIAVEDAGKA